MTPAEFKRKWARYSGKETAAYQEHFNDLCALLGQPTPATADPTGSELFCFQKRVVKDAELFALAESDRVREEPEAERERGFADVWKKGCFAWEYKGKKKNLDAAYQQLLRYRESLLNPPLLVVCHFVRYIVRTNFNGTVQETHEFTNANVDDPKNLQLLRAVFTDPEFLKPQRTTDEVTEKLAQQIGEVARSLQERESVELIDARSRRELAVAGEADWQFIQPSIMGNLFERGLDPDHRAQLGAHYTSEDDIKTLVEPVLMAPLRGEWSKIRGELAAAFVRGEGKASDRAKLSAFHDKLAAITVLDD